MPSYPYDLSGLMVNPGAELGNTTGWTDPSGTFVAINSGGGVVPRSGSWFFRAGAAASTTPHQDIALPADVLADVDAGLLRIEWGGWQAGFTDADAGRLQLQFLDGGGATLRTVENADFDATATWALRFLSAQVPAGTRTLRFTLVNTRAAGTNLDAYWDDLDYICRLILEPDTASLPTLEGTSGLDLYLRPRGAVIEQSGGVYLSRRWIDGSGNGHDVTATGSGRPTYLAAGTAGLNNLPAIQPDGVDDTMGGTAGAYSGRTGLTIIALVESDLGASNGDIIARDGPSNRGWSLGVEDGRFRFRIASSTAARTQRTGSVLDGRGVPALVIGVYDGTAGKQSLYVNGVQDDGAIDAAVPASIGGNGAALQLFNNGFANAWGGKAALIAVINRALSDAEREAIEAEIIEAYDLYQLIEDVAAASPDLDAHQGVATDGIDFYLFHTDNIKRRSGADWTTVEASNLTPFSGVATVNHIGAGAYHGGSLYAPVQFWDGSCGTASTPYLFKFDAVTLARTAAVNIAAQGAEVSACAVDTERGILWVSSFCDGSKLWKYDLSDLSYLGTLTLSPSVPWIEGLTFNASDGFLFAASGGLASVDTSYEGLIWRIDPDTGAARPIYRRWIDSTAGNEPEGLDFTQGRLYWLLVTATTTETVHTYDVYRAGVQVSPPASPPDAVSDLTAAAANTGEIDLSWTASARATGYTIERAPDVSGSAGTYAEIDTVGAVDSYRDTTVDGGTTYWYRIKASNAAGDSGYSNEASATTPALDPRAFITTFGEYDVGEDLEAAGWSEIFVAAQSAFTIAARGDATCAKVMRRTSLSHGALDDDAIVFDSLPTDGRDMQARIVTFIEDTIHPQGGVGVRVANGVGGYFARITAGPQLRLERVAAGGEYVGRRGGRSHERPGANVRRGRGDQLPAADAEAGRPPTGTGRRDRRRAAAVAKRAEPARWRRGNARGTAAPHARSHARRAPSRRPAASGARASRDRTAGATARAAAPAAGARHLTCRRARRVSHREVGKKYRRVLLGRSHAGTADPGVFLASGLFR